MALQKIKETFDKLKQYRYEFYMREYCSEYICDFKVNDILISTGSGKKKQIAKQISADRGFCLLWEKDWDFVEINSEGYDKKFDFYKFLKEVLKQINKNNKDKIKKIKSCDQSKKYIQFSIEFGHMRAEGLNFNLEKAKKTCAFNMLMLIKERKDYLIFLEKTQLKQQLENKKLFFRKIMPIEKLQLVNNGYPFIDNIYQVSKLPIIGVFTSDFSKQNQIKMESFDQNQIDKQNCQPSQNEDDTKKYLNAFKTLACDTSNQTPIISENPNLNHQNIAVNEDQSNLQQTPQIHQSTIISPLLSNPLPKEKKQSEINLLGKNYQEPLFLEQMNIFSKKLCLTNKERYFFNEFLDKCNRLGLEFYTLGSYATQSIRISKPELDVFVKNIDLAQLSQKLNQYFVNEFTIETFQQAMQINLKSQQNLTRQLQDKLNLHYKINLYLEVDDFFHQKLLQEKTKKPVATLCQVPLIFALAHQWKDDYLPFLSNSILDYFIYQITHDFNFITAPYQVINKIIYLLKVGVLDDIIQKKELNPFLFESPNEVIIKQIKVNDLQQIKNIACQWNKQKALEWIKKYKII